MYLRVAYFKSDRMKNMMQNDNIIDIPSLQWYPGRI